MQRVCEWLLLSRQPPKQAGVCLIGDRLDSIFCWGAVATCELQTCKPAPGHRPSQPSHVPQEPLCPPSSRVFVCSSINQSVVLVRMLVVLVVLVPHCALFQNSIPQHPHSVPLVHNTDPNAARMTSRLSPGRRSADCTQDGAKRGWDWLNLSWLNGSYFATRPAVAFRSVPQPWPI